MKETKSSKLGIICLILAILMIALVNLTVPIALGFLYYAYKFLYKKEEPTLRDKILITVLFLLFLLDIFLSIYLTSLYLDVYESSDFLIPEY